MMPGESEKKVTDGAPPPALYFRREEKRGSTRGGGILDGVPGERLTGRQPRDRAYSLLAEKKLSLKASG